ncbi:uncharacterized protein YbjT (DUF2867 family) [Flavobacterium sp. HSC-32F16]|uniref:NmrA/HSCARG family protein n=1 Tax=Flavobacterium sp. HSC-32F16 TaxID=2910964 RepID=UPI0020A46DBE|nr:NmrA/HSCARG family protein [Flavobacterium sp. HSC-32F16]MCP2028545.1 uncharacterized protein YbjT (DUF2867 family) [Flavobacterium sp. HSC-32F16]
MKDKTLILVAGASGTQGGAVIDALLEKNIAVRAIVRNKNSEGAKALAAKNVELAEADFADLESLVRASEGATGVFSMQMPPPSGKEGQETQQAENLVAAAKAAGIQQIVHTSVARAGDHENFIDWDKGRWARAYWEEKAAAVNAVKQAGFAYWTIIKPPLMMENLLPPKSEWMFPTLTQGKLWTPLAPDTKVDWISPKDIGRFAAEAFTQPEKFNKKEFAIVGEKLTAAEAAAKLSSVTGRKFEVQSITAEKAVELGFIPGVADSYVWMNAEGYKVDPQEAAGFGIEIESLESFLHRNKPLLLQAYSEFLKKG